MYYSEFSYNVKKLRLNRKLSQMELGERLGLNKSVISKYENGLSCPKYNILIRIAAFFGVSVDYLLGVPSGKQVDVSALSDSQREVIQHIIEEFKAKREREQ